MVAPRPRMRARAVSPAAARGVAIAVAAVAWSLAAILALAQTSAAQEVSGSIEPQLVAVGGTVELTVAVDPGDLTGSVDEPALPELPAQVAVVGRGREARVEMRGLDVRRSTVFRYTLLGTSPGTARIDPIAVRVGGRTLHTDPLVLLVVDDAETARGRAAGSPPVFVSARVDRQRAWVGQQVTLTFSFYHDPASPLAESPDYDPPQTPGFWRVELSDAPEITSERIGGRTYQVQRFRYALFPLQPGVAEIGPARVRVVQPDDERWWEPGRPRTLATDPLTVTVDSLPQGAPPGFAGAVGRYSLTGALPTREIVAGSPIELALTVQGSGNTASVGAPELPDWPEIEVGSPNVETKSDLDGLRLGGRATFRWILVPRNDGTLDLGAARLSYFDPDRGAYAVDTLRLGELRVSPGAMARSTVGDEPPRGPTLWEPRTPRAPTLRDLAGSPFYWAALAGPWLGWLAVLGWRRRPRRRSDATATSAMDLLFAGRRSLESRGAAAAPDARHAVERALELSYGVAVAGLSPRERGRELERREAPHQVVEAADAALVAIDGVRFGGVGLEAAIGALERFTAAMAANRKAARVAGAGGTIALALLLVASACGPASAPGQPAAALPQDAPIERDVLASASAQAAWSEANRAYSAGDMAAAAAAYEALAARHSDPRIEANLAAALWRQGRRGEALARYREALALAPRDAAIRADERRLWNELQRPPQPGKPVRVLAGLRLDEILIALLVASWAAALGIAVARRDRRARPVAVIALAATVFLAIAAALHAIAIEVPRSAIATAGAELHATPGGERIAPLPEGAFVRVLERAPDGWRVRASGLPAGWVAPDRIVPLD